jgi:hypothetical protein
VTAAPFPPAAFYDVARTLLSDHDGEAFLRTAIGRSYYACHHVARLGCERKWSWSPPEYGAHRAVIRKLRDQRQPYLAQQLDALLRLREWADYDLETPVDRLVCQRALSLAAWLLPRLQAL